MSIKRGDVGGTGDGTLNTIDQIVAQVAAEIRLKTAEAKIDANRAEAAVVDALEYRDQTEQLKNQAEDSATMANEAATSALDSSVQAGISRAEAEMKAIEAAASAVDAEGFALQAANEATLALQYKNDAAQSADRAELEADRAEAAADNVEMGTIPLFFVTWCPDRNHIWPGYVAADGQQLSSATYPDAAAGIAAGTVPTTDDVTWLADPTQRGKYVADDGSGFFRVPDYNGKQAGSLGAVFLRGDGGRSAGVSGEIQADAMQNITGEVGSVVASNRNVYAGASGAFYLPNNRNNGYVDSSGGSYGGDTRLRFDASRVARTADETRPLNVTGCWVIKLFGEVVNVGSADAEQLASDYANLAGRVEGLEGVSLPIGVGQTWQDVTSSRSSGTTYTNTTGRPIHVAISVGSGIVEMSGDGTNWVSLEVLVSFSFIVPAGYRYRYKTDTGTIKVWAELR